MRSQSCNGGLATTTHASKATVFAGKVFTAELRLKILIATLKVDIRGPQASDLRLQIPACVCVCVGGGGNYVCRV